METFGERVRRLREALNLNQRELAASVPGMSESAISQLENGVTKGVKPQNLIDLARALRTTPEELVEGNGTAAARVLFAREPGYGMKDVPIVGFAIATPHTDGFFDDMGFPPGSGEGYVQWPTRDPNAYALRVRGDSMEPRFRPGELIIVEPGAAVIPGNDVLVRTKDGRKMVKRLLFRRGGDVTLGSINDAHKPITISIEEIEPMQLVVGSVHGSFSKE